jgi:hypothetical protein
MGLFSDKIREIREEFKEIARGRYHSFEALLPFIVFFVLALVWRIDIAAGVAFTIGLLFLARNLLRSRSLIPPLSGLLVLAIGIFAVYRSGRAGDVLLSNIGTNGLVLSFALQAWSREDHSWHGQATLHAITPLHGTGIRGYGLPIPRLRSCGLFFSAPGFFCNCCC